LDRVFFLIKRPTKTGPYIILNKKIDKDRTTIWSGLVQTMQSSKVFFFLANKHIIRPLKNTSYTTVMLVERIVAQPIHRRDFDVGTGNH